MAEMDRDGVNQLPVMTSGRIEGMLTREDIISYLRELRGSGR
jgi:signal-transduction protein with cAMP-binding, CBS, and nucleotidyltransferase domain